MYSRTIQLWAPVRQKKPIEWKKVTHYLVPYPRHRRCRTWRAYGPPVGEVGSYSGLPAHRSTLRVLRRQLNGVLLPVREEDSTMLGGGVNHAIPLTVIMNSHGQAHTVGACGAIPEVRTPWCTDAWTASPWNWRRERVRKEVERSRARGSRRKKIRPVLQ